MSVENKVIANPFETSIKLPQHVGFSRVLRVEIRKLFNTRAAFWLLISTFLWAIVVLAIFLAIYSLDKILEASMLSPQVAYSTQTAAVTLFPVIVILLVTNEWTTRSALFTYTMVPKRTIIIGAKAVATCCIAILAWLISLIVTFLFLFIIQANGHDKINYDFSFSWLMFTLLASILKNFMAFGFALLMMNTPASIVAYYVLPMIIQPLALISPKVLEIIQWLWVQHSSYELLLMESKMDAIAWAQLAVSNGIWVILPIAAGIWIQKRREIK